jgi:hypothetical protein
MKLLGIDKFKIELIKIICVDNRKKARIIEQEEIDKIDKNICLNKLRAYSENREKTRDIEKKRFFWLA